MNSIDFINPYQLFGVTEDSAIEEVRKAYYSIALLCHPDKGGHTDYMKTLTLAYKWICDQISCEVEHRKTFEEYFGTEIQTAYIPNFTDIMVESTGYTKDFFKGLCHEVSITDPKIIEQLYIPNFNSVMSLYRHIEGTEPVLPSIEELTRYTLHFLRHYLHAPEDMFLAEVYVPMSIPHGYNMESQQETYDNGLYSKTMTIYKDPLVTPRKTEAILETKEKLEDYSIDAPIAMNDYQEAFTSYTEDLKKLETLISTVPFEEALQTYRTERSLQNCVL
uniref:J domain-containing protein n=1 Tax=viral metagenome TaxID=1070528 RepID=A0A6C0CS73_9ZZZZ